MQRVTLPFLNKRLLYKHCQAMSCMSFKGQFNTFRTVEAKLVKDLRTMVKKADQNRIKSSRGFLQRKRLSGSACDVVTSQSKWVAWQKEISRGKNRGGRPDVFSKDYDCVLFRGHPTDSLGTVKLEQITRQDCRGGNQLSSFCGEVH